MVDTNTPEAQETIAKLDKLEKHLEQEFTYAALETENLFHEEEKCIIRSFKFNTGEREEIAVLGSNGYMYGYWATKENISNNFKWDLLISVLLFYAKEAENEPG
jgi:hypothetical protein